MMRSLLKETGRAFKELEILRRRKIAIRQVGLLVVSIHNLGQFGIGFNAVFNYTDLPIIISGEDMLIQDPPQKSPWSLEI